MATGDYYIDASGLEEVARALEQSKGGIRDLRVAYRNIAEDAERYVRRHVPVGTASRKDGYAHGLPGGLRRSVTSGVARSGPWVSAGNRATPYIFVQEFGGASFWHRSGARAIRSQNRAHRSIAEVVERTGIRGHVVYKKARKPHGYFIWNVAYRLRSQIGRNLHENLSLVLERHGIPYEMPANPALGIQPMANPGRAA